MTGALRYEWMRIHTIRSSYWMSALAIVLSGGVAFILVLVVNTADNNGDLGDLAPSGVYTTWIVTSGASGPGIPVLAAVFFAVIGAMAMGHEYRYGTNKATLSALPDRLTVLAAKTLVLSAWVAVSALAILLVNSLLVWLFVDSAHLDGASVRPMLFFVLYCIGFGLAGFGLSAILRNQTGSIVAVLVWPLVLEPIVFAILRATSLSGSDAAGLGKIANFLPASAGRRTIFRPYEIFSDLDVSAQTTIWGLAPSTIVFWVGIAVLVVAGSTLFIKRDA
jgi:ABC-2 type transport system permease protein